MKLKFNSLIKGLFFLLCFVAMSNTLSAQRTVSGVVTDGETKEPLIGATIVAVGTSTGTITDFDGKYTLSVPEGATALEFSYTGYADQVIELGASNVVDVVLAAGTVLDEVVVVGYGTATREEVTSSVTSVKSEDFNQGLVNDPIQLIQGKVPGLAISSVGGDPNGGSTLRLRGLSTLGANTEPLVVIDGVIGASLESVDPSDIESMDVLKDGSAAAIYGTRASSGVILITTKSGSRGDTKVEYNASITSEQVAEFWAVASPAEYRSIRPAEADQGSNTDWMDAVTDNALSHQHNLSMSGGINGTSYRASFNFRDVDGVGLNTGFDQLNGRLNLTQKAMNDRLTIGLNVSATQRKAQYGFGEAFRYAVTYNPTAPITVPESDPSFDQFGGYFQSVNFDYFNPVAIAEQNINEGIEKDLMVNLSGAYEIVDGLTAKVNYSLLQENDLLGQYSPFDSYWRGFNAQGIAQRRNEDRANELFEVTGLYDNSFGSTDLEVLLGYSHNQIGTENFQAFGREFISNATTYNNLGFGALAAQGDPNAVTSFKEEYKVIGFFGRAQVNIDDTYYLMGSLRQEGSTRFGENNKWGLFPAASAGVNVAKLIDAGGVDNLKVRVGFGQTGSLPPESYLSLFRYTQQGSFFFNGSFVPAFGPNRNANPDLKWETKTEINAGIDFAFMDYKLTGSLDFYNRTTNDLIFNVQVPVPPNFASRTWANLEDVELSSTGVELLLSYNHANADKSFTWVPTVTFATYNTVLDLVDVADPTFQFFQSEDKFFQDVLTSPGAPGLNDNPTLAVIGGEEIGQIYGPVYSGVGDDGTWQFEDLDGDGTIEVGRGEDDNQVIGNGLPDFSIGFQNMFTFGNLDFSFFLRGDFGHDLVNMMRVFYENSNDSRIIDNILQTDLFLPNLTEAPRFSSYHVEDASYLVIDNASLGYTFDLPDDAAFSKVRLVLSGRNLAWFTNYQGLDPSPRYADPGAADNGGNASRQFNPDPLSPGLDRRNNYFRTTQFTFGVNLGF